MKNILLGVFILIVVQSFAQQKTILIFDMENGSLDSIVNIPYDTTTLSDKTPWFVGTINADIETLEQFSPVQNLYPNSQFTRKKTVSGSYNLTKFPIRTSVKIFTEVNDTLNDHCSGSMVSRRHVLTAAHCVAAINSNTISFDSLYVCPDYDNGNFSNTFPCSWVKKIYIFKDRQLLGEDFAILELKEPIGDLTGWISMGFNSVDSSLLNGIFYKFSYPATTILALDSNEYNGDTLYFNYGKADISDNNIIGIHNTNAIPGESGSSLIKILNNQDYTSYGVLTFSSDLKHSKLNNWKYYYLESILQNDLSIGIEDLSNDTLFNVFPNPARDNIRIRNNINITIMKIDLIDFWGRIILSRVNLSSGSYIDISGIPNGMYFLRIQSNNVRVTKKLIIQAF